MQRMTVSLVWPRTRGWLLIICRACMTISFREMTERTIPAAVHRRSKFTLQKRLVRFAKPTLPPKRVLERFRRCSVCFLRSRMLRNVIAAIGFIALSAQTAGTAPPAPSASVIAATANARAFASAAALGNVYEVQAGQLAFKKAESMDVRDFAQMMVSDNTETSA